MYIYLKLMQPDPVYVFLEVSPTKVNGPTPLFIYIELQL